MPELLGRTLPDKPCQTKFHTQHGEEVKWHVSTGYRFQRSVVSGYRMHGADGGGGGVLGGGVAGSCDADTFRMHVQVESARGKLDVQGRGRTPAIGRARSRATAGNYSSYQT